MKKRKPENEEPEETARNNEHRQAELRLNKLKKRGKMENVQ